MIKSNLKHSLAEKYNAFLDYINGLSNEEYLFSYQQKWTAAQQLEHIVLCLKPLVQFFGLDRSTIIQKFGKVESTGRNYDVLLRDYVAKLNEGGKAPEQYVPTTSSDDREILNMSLLKMIDELCLKIETFTEWELDTLGIPHPLLGKLSLREMLFNAIYHVEHHHEATKLNLKHIN